MRRQLMKELRVSLNRGQHFCCQSGRITTSGFPAFDGIEAGSQHFRHFALRNIQIFPDSLDIGHFIARHAGG